MKYIQSEKLDINNCLLWANNITETVKAQKPIAVEMARLKAYYNCTYIHSIHVSVLSVLIGIILNFNNKELENLSQAALLHDIGKTYLPLELLNKPDKLTNEEFAEIKNHPLYGYNLLKENNCVVPAVKNTIISHHENEDGTGYPNKLTSAEIPIFSKIIHITDVYDALTSKRAYKDTMPPAEALEYLSANSGTMFDANLTKCFICFLQPINNPTASYGLEQRTLTSLCFDYASYPAVS